MYQTTSHLYLWTPTWRHGWKIDPPPIETPVGASKTDVNPALQLNSVESPQEALNDTSPAIKRPVDTMNWHNASLFQPVYYLPHSMAYMQHMESLLAQQQQHTLTLMLPQPELPVFGGDPIEYCSFIRAFESIIESRTQISSSRFVLSGTVHQWWCERANA